MIELLIIQVFFSLLLFCLSLVANYVGSYILSHLNLNLQPVNDFLLLIIPRIYWMGYVADATLLLIGALTLYSLRHNLKQMSFVINTVSFALFIRSFLILLTPTSNSFGIVEYTDLLSFTKYPSGMFPSGHTICAFLSYLFIKSHPNKSLHTLMFLLLILEIMALIASHGHYSIDIVGGLMLAYIIYRKGLDYQKTHKQTEY
ncbi:phosphatase PAP2 family protein [Candidatus Shapirobacteria bacterium]|nr:phosphatase PAP2 family protein [Candidatus Shapirobacteria bacterium]